MVVDLVYTAPQFCTALLLSSSSASPCSMVRAFTDAAGYNALRTDLLDCNYVSSISFTEDTTELFDNLIVSLGYVVVLIIICAAALAAVVLYNLISVNLLYVLTVLFILKYVCL